MHLKLLYYLHKQKHQRNEDKERIAQCNSMEIKQENIYSYYSLLILTYDGEYGV